MTDDFVRDLGYVTLGSRLKRLGERMQAEVARLIKAEGLDVPPGTFPILGALDRDGMLTVGGLAEALGVTQPGITRALPLLEARGLVKSGRAASDQRQRTVRLSHKGVELVARTKQDLWLRVGRAVSDICEPLKGPILDQLDAIEAALSAAPLDRRAAKPGKRKDRDQRT
jgi:DNA-binding MarR family transcriptional regulator